MKKLFLALLTVLLIYSPTSADVFTVTIDVVDNN